MHLLLLAATPALQLTPCVLSVRAASPLMAAREQSTLDVDRYCGGASPFTPFRGGGSVGDHMKWSQASDWATRREERRQQRGVVVETSDASVEVVAEAAADGVVEANAAEDAADAVVVEARPTAKRAIRVASVPSSFDQNCGGATAFAPFHGGGSVGNQMKWSQGGDWYRRGY